MVAPFLAWVLWYTIWTDVSRLKLFLINIMSAYRSLKSWILSHQPPAAPRPDMPLKGLTSLSSLRMLKYTNRFSYAFYIRISMITLS
jgi:hypothetical protein